MLLGFIKDELLLRMLWKEDGCCFCSSGFKEEEFGFEKLKMFLSPSLPNVNDANGRL
jgi:hypothetical protein